MVLGQSSSLAVVGEELVKASEQGVDGQVQSLLDQGKVQLEEVFALLPHLAVGLVLV